MRDKIVTNYAKALADVALESGEVDATIGDLDAFASMYEASRDLRDVLISPSITFDQKRGVIEALGVRISATSLVGNLVLTLLKNGRIAGLSQVAEGYRREIDRRRGIQRAKVSSTRQLSNDVRKKLEETMGGLAEGRIHFDYSLDPDLIGGVKVRVGSTVYDGSIRTKLDEIERRLSSQ